MLCSCLQNVPPDLAICTFILEQSLSVRALQEMLANTVEMTEVGFKNEQPESVACMVVLTSPSGTATSAKYSKCFPLFLLYFMYYIYIFSHTSSPSFFALCQTGSRFGQVGMLVKMSYFLCPSPQPSASVLVSSLF